MHLMKSLNFFGGKEKIYLGEEEGKLWYSDNSDISYRSDSIDNIDTSASCEISDISYSSDSIKI